MKLKKRPYESQTDREKLIRNWNKTLKLLSAKEYSMSIIRAGTCAEIAANLMVREELESKRSLKKEFVDHLLIWANGLHGKVTKILKPLLRGLPEGKILAAVEARTRNLNEARNKIAHGGHFSAREHAHEMVGYARDICVALAKPYHPAIEFRKR